MNPRFYRREGITTRERYITRPTIEGRSFAIVGKRDSKTGSSVTRSKVLLLFLFVSAKKPPTAGRSQAE
jgi:hypothetical protein